MDKRQFIKTIALTSALLPLTNSASANAARKNTSEQRLPVALNKGDTVALICPSSAISDSLEIQVAREVLEAFGFNVKPGKYLSARRGNFAGADIERASDINDAFADKNIKAIICLAGGSGAARLLPLLNYKTIRNNPKALLGFSDITALHSAINAQTGLITFHGPNATGSWDSFNTDQFQRLFFQRELMRYENVRNNDGDLAQRQNRTAIIRGGKAHGELIGGNMSVFTALAGSPYLPDFSGKILFLEDVGEAPYRIDRMLSTLKLMGALDKIAGFIFGACVNCNPGDGYGSLTLEEIFNDYIKPLNIPAYRGAMIGHIKQQFIVPIGGMVEMDADAVSFRLVDQVFQFA
ncbi:MAG: LD-carboxypeptidase [Cellvibrio sp. 79]|nr:MAG: LD-carboxypeptidase [Cellvibrio sp. 79]